MLRNLINGSTRLMASELKRVPIPRRGVDYRGKVVLAPMVRSGEMPSRLLALHYGADLVWGPETVDRAMIGTTRHYNERIKVLEWSRANSKGETNAIFRMHPELEGKKLIFQIGTSDPDRAVEASRLVAADVAGIDVNAGCPKPFSTSGGMGAALLRTPDKLVAILDALVKHIASEFEIGISVKIRILEDPAETEALVRRLVATGITGLTVHCRYPPTRPREAAMRHQMAMISGICKEAGVACVINGDVTCRDEAIKLMEEHSVDGAMIATAAETNPSCFRSESDGGLAPWEEPVKRYMETCIEVENKYGNTKFLLAQMIPGKKMPPGFTSCKGMGTMAAALGYDHLVERGTLLDQEFADMKQKVKEANAKPAQKNNNQNKGRKPARSNQSALAAGGDMATARLVAKPSRPARGAGGQGKAESEASAVPV